MVRDLQIMLICSSIVGYLLFFKVRCGLYHLYSIQAYKASFFLTVLSDLSLTFIFFCPYRGSYVFWYAYILDFSNHTDWKDSINLNLDDDDKISRTHKVVLNSSSTFLRNNGSQSGSQNVFIQFCVNIPLMIWSGLTSYFNLCVLFSFRFFSTSLADSFALNSTSVITVFAFQALNLAPS